MGLHGLDLVDSNAWEKHHELPIHGVRSERQIQWLISKLTESQQSANRVQHLVYEIKSSPQAFSGDQVIALAPYFPGTELVLALHLLDNHLFGLRCDQAVQLLKMIQVPEECLEALQVIDENLLDPVNRFQLRNLFPPHLLPQVDQILAETRGQSHIFGSITSSRVIFLIDTSGTMNTEFQTHCGQYFNRLQYIIHDLHKLLYHRVQPDFKFNIIHFNTHAYCWKPSLTPATPEYLKEAEHYLDHLEADGQTNTYNALKLALSDEEADTIYLLSGGEPSMDMNAVLSDLKVWLQQRRNPCVIHTIAFLIGHTSDDPRPRKFMAEIAAMTHGVFRCMDPFTLLHKEFGDDLYNDDPDFDDDEFVDFLKEKLRDVPLQLLQNVSMHAQLQYPLSAMAKASTPYKKQSTYPVQQHQSSPNFKSQLRSRLCVQDEIAIPSSHHEHGHDCFDIHVNIRQIVPGRDVQWSVIHTFDEFKQLHHQLQNQCPIPPFPPHHHYVSHMTKHDREKRRQDLEIYLKKLYVSVSPYEHSEFDLFLSMHSHVNEIVQQEEIE